MILKISAHSRSETAREKLHTSRVLHVLPTPVDGISVGTDELLAKEYR